LNTGKHRFILTDYSTHVTNASSLFLEIFLKAFFSFFDLDSDRLSSIMHVIDHVSMCGSVFMMVALTLERHFAICSPHAYRLVPTKSTK
jgi:hypothetical protein